MKVLLQRVSHASVTVDQRCVGEISRGLLLLVGFGQGDDGSKLGPMSEKLVNLRVFEDEKGKFQHSLLDIQGAALLVPQFTLYAETSKGRRPDFFSALAPAAASELFNQFVEVMRKTKIIRVAVGEFGAHMKVSLLNDGPVTIMLEM